MEQPKQKKQKKIKSIKVTLSSPFEWGDELIEEIVLQRPKAKDLEHLSVEPKMKELLEVARKCARWTNAQIRELDSEDVMEVVEAVSDFLDSGHRTGRVRSY